MNQSPTRGPMPLMSKLKAVLIASAALSLAACSDHADPAAAAATPAAPAPARDPQAAGASASAAPSNPTDADFAKLLAEAVAEDGRVRYEILRDQKHIDALIS